MPRRRFRLPAAPLRTRAGDSLLGSGDRFIQEGQAMEFRPGPIEGVVWTRLQKHGDTRGWLCELFRRDELPPGFCPVMAYVSLTGPGVARGPHEHAEQTDCFCFLGPSSFRVYLWDARPSSPTCGNRQTELV